MTAHSLVFLIGYSGVGKTELAKLMVRDMGFRHFDADRGDYQNGIDVEGLRFEWDRFYGDQNDAVALARTLNERINSSGHCGAVMSFPSTATFDRSKVDIAAQSGIQTILLDGRAEWCWRAFVDRRRRRGETVQRRRWDQNNEPAIALYSTSTFDDLRLPAFRSDGSRFSGAELMAAVRQCLRVRADKEER
jgi:adenylate kinase family enzyme